MPDGSSLADRLAALGYAEGGDAGDVAIAPEQVNRVVRENLDELDGGIIRYLKPHPPLAGLEGLTSGPGKVRRTMEALASGSVTVDELEEAYERTYRVAFEAMLDILPELDGRVAVTADHGECLRCGQLFHADRFDPHDHLVEVPWFEVER